MGQGPNLMTSFNINYLLIGLSPHTVILGIQHRSGGGDTVQSRLPSCFDGRAKERELHQDQPTFPVWVRMCGLHMRKSQWRGLGSVQEDCKVRGPQQGSRRDLPLSQELKKEYQPPVEESTSPTSALQVRWPSR